MCFNIFYNLLFCTYSSLHIPAFKWDFESFNAHAQSSYMVVCALSRKFQGASMEIKPFLTFANFREEESLWKSSHRVLLACVWVTEIKPYFFLEGGMVSGY